MLPYNVQDCSLYRTPNGNSLCWTFVVVLPNWRVLWRLSNSVLCQWLADQIFELASGIDVLATDESLTSTKLHRHAWRGTFMGILIHGQKYEPAVQQDSTMLSCPHCSRLSTTTLFSTVTTDSRLIQAPQYCLIWIVNNYVRSVWVCYEQ